MTLQEQLCEKMRVEQSAYCLWLTAQPPEEILNHAYEYSVREDIILATEEMNLTPARVRALLKSPAPLADVYKDFSKLETDYMSIVAQCVEDRADDLLKKEQQQNPPKVYRLSVTYAREHGELQQYHASCHLNERCRDEIDAALAQRFDGMRLGAGAVEQVVAEYGLERTKYVFLTINEKTHQSESCEDLHTAPQLCHRLLDDMAITVMMQTKRNHNFTNMDKDEAVRVRAFWKPVIEKLPDYAYLCDEILREAQENEEENGIDLQ